MGQLYTFPRILQILAIYRDHFIDVNKIICAFMEKPYIFSLSFF